MRKLLLALVGMMVAAVVAAAPPPVLQINPPPPPAPAVTDDNVLLLDLSSGGRVKIVMRPDIAPHHVERIRTLARQGFYDGTVFHRVIDGFMAQGGDPTGTGNGGSKLPDLQPEFNTLPHVRGAVAMARAGKVDSANSQFYIVLSPTLKLDGTYTVWGRVVDGMEYVDAIQKGEPPANPTKIIKASIAADHIPPPAPQSLIPAVPAAAPPETAAPESATPSLPAGPAKAVTPPPSPR